MELKQVSRCHEIKQGRQTIQNRFPPGLESIKRPRGRAASPTEEHQCGIVGKRYRPPIPPPICKASLNAGVRLVPVGLRFNSAMTSPRRVGWDRPDLISIV